MDRNRQKRARRRRKHVRVRKNLSGTAERPRFCVFRSLKHIYGQIVDDTSGRTLVSASTLSPELKSKVEGASKTEAAKLLGKHVAVIAKDKGITTVVFDRGGYKFHGRVKALADAAREGGLVF